MRCFSRMINNLGKEQRGNVLIIVALLMVSLLGMTALVIDVGYLYQARRQMVSAADAGALAGAQELVNNPFGADAKAREFAVVNGSEPDKINVSINGNRVMVESGRTVDFAFAPVLGISNSIVTARATAVYNPLVWGEGIVPWAVPLAALEGLLPDEEDEGEEGEGEEEVPNVILKFGSQGNEIGPGNFHCLALGGTGANLYRDNIKEGYDGTIKIGDWLTTETGNMSGPTSDGVIFRINKGEEYRYVTVPLFVEVSEKPGRTEIQVVAFAVFYLDSVRGQGNNSIVEGRFVEKRFVPSTCSDEYDPSIDYGAYNIRLVE